MPPYQRGRWLWRLYSLILPVPGGQARRWLEQGRSEYSKSKDCGRLKNSGSERNRPRHKRLQDSRSERSNLAYILNYSNLGNNPQCNSLGNNPQCSSLAYSLQCDSLGNNPQCNSLGNSLNCSSLGNNLQCSSLENNPQCNSLAYSRKRSSL